jgi:hypothetical protein
MTTRDRRAEQEEIEMLLPWHAAGTLSRREAARVEAALAADAELARRYALVREELAATIHVNETLGAPPARAMERLFAGIDGIEREGRRRASPAFDLAGWIDRWMGQLSPRALAWSAAAALLVIALQAGLLAGLYMREQARNETYETALPGETVPAAGVFALVRFNPAASFADITRFLEAHNATVVAGPMAGNLFRIRIGDTTATREEVAQIIDRMARETAVVGFVVAAP